MALQLERDRSRRGGQRPAGTHQDRGEAVNPVTDAPDGPNAVLHAGYARVLAEFRADGSSSETPPGH